MNNRTRTTAERFNILENLTAFENDLMSLDRVTAVNFDIDGLYDGINYIIIVPKYDIPVGTENYFEVRKQVLNSILEVGKSHGLSRTEDRIEDYGEHWYIVFKCGSEWDIRC